MKSVLRYVHRKVYSDVKTLDRQGYVVQNIETGVYDYRHPTKTISRAFQPIVNLVRSLALNPELGTDRRK